MERYPEEPSLTIAEIVEHTLFEGAKAIPFFGLVPGALQSMSGQLEIKRLTAYINELRDSLSKLEKDLKRPVVIDEATCAVIAFAAEQARSDILAKEKAKEYAAVVTQFAKNPGDFNEVFEVLDSLRRISLSDLNVLYKFRVQKEIARSVHMHDLAGYQMYINPGDERKVLENMATLYPALLRLEGLGILYLTKANPFGEEGMILGEKSRWRTQLEQTAFLTETGVRLVSSLPRR